MANNRREVDLIVRAKDDTSRVVGLINKVLDVFVDKTEQVTSASSKADRGMAGLSKAFSDLDRALKGQTAVTTLAGNLDKANSAMGRLQERSTKLEGSLNELKGKYGETAAQAAKLAERQGQLQARMGAQTVAIEKQKEALKASRDAFGAVEQAESSYQSKSNSLIKQIDTVEKRIAATTKRYEEQAGAIEKSDAPTARMVRNLSNVQTSAEKLFTRLGALNQELAENQRALEIAGSVSAAYAADVERADKAFQQEQKAARDTQQALRQLGKELADNKRLQAEMTEDVALSTAALERNRAEIQKSEAEVAQLAASYEKAGAATEALAQKTRGSLREAVSLQQSQAAQLGNTYKSLQLLLAQAGKAMDEQKVPTRETAEAYFGLQKAVNAVKAEWRQQEAVFDSMKNELRELPSDLESVRAASEKFANGIRDSADAMIRAEKTARSVQNAYDAFAASQRRVAAPEVAVAINQQSLGLERAFRATKLAAASSRDGAAATDTLSQAYRDLYGETRTSLSYMQRLRGEVLSLIATYGGFFAVIEILRSVVEATTKLEAAQVRLNAIYGEGGTEKAAADYEFIRREANRLGVDISVLAEEYTKFASATKNTNLEGSETRRIFLRTAEAGRVMGLGLEDMQGIFRALTQIVSKGKVQLEELQGQLGDRLPGALQIMADGLGITVAELQDLTKKGEVSSDALSKFADNLEKRYGKALPDALKSTSAEIGRFQNSLTQAALALGQGGFIEGFNALLRSMTEVLQSSDFQGFLRDVSSLLGVMAKALALVIENWKVLVAVLGLFAGIKVYSILVQMAAALGEVTIGATAASAAIARMQAQERLYTTTRAFGAMEQAAVNSTGAVGRLGQALRFVASPAGLAAAAVAGVGYGIYQLFNQMPDVNQALSDNIQIMDKVGIAFDTAGKSLESFRKSFNALTIDQARANLATLEEIKQFKSDDIQDRLNQIIESAKDPVAMTSPRDAAAATAIRDLTKSFEAGKTGLNEYVNGLDAIKKQYADVSFNAEAWITSLQTGATATDDQNKKIERLKDLITALTGSQDEATAAWERLKEAGSDAANSSKDVFEQTAKYNAELEKMQGIVPDLNESLKEMKNLAKLDDAFASASKYVQTIGQLLGLIKTYNVEKQKIFDQQANSDFRGYSNSLDITRKLIQDKESFSATPYKDNDGRLRIGYGSDQVTLDDGSIKSVVEGMRVSVADANRDLDRRIGEFTEKITAKIGTDNFSALNPAQQAALTSITYNYGSLPDRIAKVINDNGTADQVAEAIRGLGSDNGGINANRRNYEASLYSSQTGVDIQEADYKKTQEEKARADEAAKKRADEYHDSLKENLNVQQQENAAIGQSVIARETAKAVAEAEARAIKAGTKLTDAERASIVKSTAEKYKQADIDDRRKKTEEVISNLMERRNQLQAQYTAATNAGDFSGAAKIKSEMADVNSELEKAIGNAQNFFKTYSGPDAAAAVEKLNTMAMEAKNFATQGKAVYFSWQEAGRLLAEDVTSAFDTFAQEVAKGTNIAKAAKMAFMQLASQFLIDIGHMIIRQVVFNAVSGLMGSFGLPGLTPGANGLFHSGTGSGTVASTTPNRTKTINPMLWATAPRFHNGYAGLAPGEVPAIVQDTEAILTKDDPFHPKNRAKLIGSMAGEGGGGQPLTIINTFDPADVVEAGMNTPRGQRILLNQMGKNKSAIKKTLGG